MTMNAKEMGTSDDSSLYSLSWSYFEKNLKAAFNNQKSLQKYSDVTFLCQDKTLHAHKIILHAGSDYFRDLFENQHANSNLMIYMFHVKSIVLKKLLEYLYFGEVQIGKRHLQEFIMLAQSLKVKGLANRQDDLSDQPDYANNLNKPIVKRKNVDDSTISQEKMPKEDTQVLTLEDEDDESADEVKEDDKDSSDDFAKMEVDVAKTDDSLVTKREDGDEDETKANYGRAVTKSFSRYQRIVANIKKTENGPHEITTGTRRRCGQCSIRKIEKRTNLCCRICNVALCFECFDPFHKTFDCSAKMKNKTF